MLMRLKQLVFSTLAQLCMRLVVIATSDTFKSIFHVDGEETPLDGSAHVTYIQLLRKSTKYHTKRKPNLLHRYVTSVTLLELMCVAL